MLRSLYHGDSSRRWKTHSCGTSDEHVYAQLLKWRIRHMVVVGLSLSIVKTSVCLFLLRLATRKAYCWFLCGVIAFLVPFAITYLLLLILQCHPIAAAWHVNLLPPPMGTGTAKCFSPAIWV
ncbi:hypothetical protein BDU57DRAFT_61479 [Ampelomyces quisqualis]|uniref:Rhodopsin domain-containing protein n=1 Tax=Ampelomyces quisqualis TaxID=50730 RepID=A0A6A5R251_AMPQU|nr:hypothetical protein BDU57DRAFT_61479 [Ampelomyces quisqualis]